MSGAECMMHFGMPRGTSNRLEGCPHPGDDRLGRLMLAGKIAADGQVREIAGGLGQFLTDTLAALGHGNTRHQPAGFDEGLTGFSDAVTGVIDLSGDLLQANAETVLGLGGVLAQGQGVEGFCQQPPQIPHPPGQTQGTDDTQGFGAEVPVPQVEQADHAVTDRRGITATLAVEAGGVTTEEDIEPGQGR